MTWAPTTKGADLSERELRERVGRERKIVDKFLRLRPEGRSVAELRKATEEARAAHGRLKELRRALGVRQHVDWIESAPLRRQLEQDAKAKAERRKRLEPAAKAARLVVEFAHPELAGARLVAANLSEEEGVELLALVEERREGALTPKAESRYRQLVGTLAGSPSLFEDAARERAIGEREAALAEKARLDAMPLRRFEGKGGAFLPGYLHDWLMDPDEGSMSLTHLGVLGVLLLAFEHAETPFAGSEVVDGVIVLDPGLGFTLSRTVDPYGDLGAGRVRESVAYLAANGWFDVDTADGRTRIRPGERLRTLLEEAEAAAVT